MQISTFITKRLILRQVTLDDIVNYEKYFVDYNVIKYLRATVPWPYPDGGIQDYIEQEINPYLGKDRWLWGIFLKTFPNELIGAVELRRVGNPENRGFWLGKKFWGQGIMTEAIAPITNYAFDTLGFEKMIFTNATGNNSSHRIKEKTGARFLYKEPAKFVDSELMEQEVWEFTREDWQAFINKVNKC